MKSNNFGDEFIWGAAISAIQTEGAHNTYGKGLSIWDEFALKKGKIKNHENPLSIPRAAACGLRFVQSSDRQRQRRAVAAKA